MELNSTKYTLNAINNPIFNKVANINKNNEECSKIREAIIRGKEKLNSITLAKYLVDEGILYYKDRLWVPQQMYTDIIIEIYD